MTTTVTIDAHLSEDKEVQVLIIDVGSEDAIEEFTLQDGESAERYVYDDRKIMIQEVEKL